MTDEEAREALAAAARERDAAKAAWDNSREHLYDVIRKTAGVIPQVEVAQLTGYHRERIRLLTSDPSRLGIRQGPRPS